MSVPGTGAGTCTICGQDETGPLRVAAAGSPPPPFVCSYCTERGRFTGRALAFDGFAGFITFEELRSRLADVPTSGGVYVVIRESDEPCDFLVANPGGRFKQRDPSVTRDVLTAKWVDGSHLVYLGKGDNIQRRLKQYADFGAGKPVGHWGGRYIWQLADSASLLVAWKLCEPNDAAASMEARLLREFKGEHDGRLPFANIANPT